MGVITIIFVGTKKTIFINFIKLVSQYGFENVSMKDIAKESKIKAASIYNYFVGKDEILDQVYECFLRHYRDGRNSAEEVKAIVKTCTARELVQAIWGQGFLRPDAEHEEIEIMVLTSKIVYMRMFNDPKARKIFTQDMVQIEIDYIKDIMRYGIEIGRVQPFDVETFARFFNGQIHFMGITAFLNPEYRVEKLDEEDRIFDKVADMIPMNDPIV